MILVFAMCDRAALHEEASDDVIRSTFAAGKEGFPVCYLGDDFTADELPRLLEDVAPEVRTVGVLEGRILSVEKYTALHRELAARGVDLINTPELHQRAMELDHALPLLGDLTPKTFVMKSLHDLDAAVDAIGLPAFVKGAVLSYKHLGLQRCVANTRAELQSIARMLFEDSHRSRGRVLVRALAPLVRGRVSPIDFPPGREFRVYLYQRQVVGWGFYWPWLLDFAELDEEERDAMLATAVEASRLLEIPYLSVDVAQIERDGSREWIVIEVGDPQCSAHGLMNIKEAWHRLRELVALSE